jgi:glycine/D-amino acid oxidase-like deaminating enzyme/nitrite reductase/ring-hydroxylating ferredoxin subunit
MNPTPFNEINPDITSGRNRSYWTLSTKPIQYETLKKNIETDVLVVGGGISGLTTAYCLSRSGRKVVLVEDGFIGSGESGRTTAHITYALDDRYSEIENMFGHEKALLAANSHMTAIQWINSVIHTESISCHFKRVPGYLFLHNSDKMETLEKEYQVTKKLGLYTEALPDTPGISALVEKRCIKFPGQAQFHIMMYLKGLSEAFIRKGGRIFTESRAENITKEGATVNGYKVKASQIVVATNSPVNDMVTMHTKQYPYRTYVIAASIRKGTLPYSLWWDTGDQLSKWVTKPYHYVRLEEFDEKFDLLIAGGEDHKIGQAEKEDIPEQNRYENLVAWTRKNFPAAETIAYKWSGQVMEPLDSLAFIGKNPGEENIFIITGDSGNGMTYGTIGGILISDLILGKKNMWESLYDPSRKPTHAGGDYVKEAVNMAAQYSDWISAGDVKELSALKPRHGGIFTSGLKKVAVYRDDMNVLHAYSAVCPHLGGIVRWNSDEMSFDCPAHGSRFTTGGKVINGPSQSDLKKIEIKE